MSEQQKNIDPNNGSKSPLDKLDLPFMKQHEDWASWAYDHRVGLLATVLIFSIAGVLFLSMRIYLKQESPFEGMVIELPYEPEKIEPEKIEQKFTEMSSTDFDQVKNVKVNKDASLDAGLKDAKNSDAQDIYKDAQALQDRLNASRSANERSLKDATEEMGRVPDSKKGTKDTEKESNVKGKVTVSYWLSGRHATHLHVPAYTCRGGGEVEVAIVVNRRGEVVDATVNKSSSTNDECLKEMAVKSAYASSFNADTKAKDRQEGTISYVFIPQ